MQTWKIPLILFYYGFCSSTLIVINKVAVSHLRAPVFILVLQLLFAAGSVKFLTLLGTLDAERLQWQLVRPFILIIVGFLGTVFGEWSSHIRQLLIHNGIQQQQQHQLKIQVYRIQA
jgi:hypothetical protein